MTASIDSIRSRKVSENTILQSLSIAIGTEVAGRIEFANDSLCRVTGFKLSELKGRNLKLLFEDSPEFDIVEILREIFNNGSTSIFTSLKRKNGESIKALCHFSLLSSDDHLPGIAFFIYDFNEQNRDLQTIYQQVELLGNLFKSITHPFLVIRTKDYKVVKANSASISEDAKNLSTCYSLTHGFDGPCSGAQHPCPLKEVTETRKPVMVRHKHYDEDGKPVNSEVFVYPVVDNSGDVKNIIEYSIDVSDRATTNLKVNGEEKLFRDLYEKATLGIYRSTPECKIIMANPAAIAILGYSSLDELLKINVEQGYYDIKDRIKFQSIMQNEGTTYGFETKWRRGDNIITDISISAHVIKDENDNILYYEGVVEDITEKKRAEEEIIRAKEEAEEMNRLKSNFLANVSHELRTPLSGILGFAEILKEEIKDPFQREIVGNINQSGLRLLRTLDSVMNFSKLEAEKVELIRTNLDISDAISTVVSWFEKVALRKNLKLETKLEKPLEAELDENLFKQILSNLIENSIKYTLKGKVVVELDSEKREGMYWVVIKVRDTGIGINPESQKYIFDAFRQGSEGLSRKYEGMGLGLTITKKYIELMDGKIEFESTPGVGSNFIVKFPCHPVPMAASNNKLNEDVDGNNKTTESIKILPRVLLVENEQASVEITKYFLKNVCDIDAVDNGKDALVMLIEKNYRAVIMDIDLAGLMDGIETTREMRKLPLYKETPIIALTAYAMKGDKEKILMAGCSHYMSKPFKRDEITALMSSILSPKIN